jgi:hypothetical protein
MQNAQFFLFPYILVFFISMPYFFCLYWFTNRAIFFSKEKKKKKLLPCLSNGILCHCFVEFKVGGVIFDWLKLLQESKV